MRVAIAWYGAEGKSSYEYYRAKGHDVTIVTPRESPDFPIPSDAKSITGDDAFDQLDGFDLVIRSAATRPDALITDGRVWSSTNEFFAECPAPIIGVTGTKGKGTTCSLIASILRAAGKTVHLVGNIGTPALDVLPRVQPDDIVVFELSSFQLWDLETSPHLAVVLMIEPDHQDVHTSMEEYVDAKANIRRYQSGKDVCLYHPTNELSKQIAAASDDGLDRAYRYGVAEDSQVYVNDDMFSLRDRAICSVDSLKLPGAYNRENACAAMSAVSALLGDVVTNEQYAEGLESFQGLPHRLSFVAEKSGVKYYDDSIATTPGSALADVKSFEEPIVLLLGGHEKGGDYTELLAECAKRGVTVVAYGENRDMLKSLCDEAGVTCYVESGTMVDVVEKAAILAQAGSVVILSPAASSFDMFKNYSDRGDQFATAVGGLI